jgi:hypothetical protein
MKILVAICSHKAAHGHQIATRETWLGLWGHLVDCRFLLGNGNDTPANDEWIFQVDDTYAGMPAKFTAMFQRALAEGYDYVFLTGIDTYVIIPRLLAVNLEGVVYAGGVNDDGGLCWVGGAGVWFGLPAIEVLARQVASNQPHPDDWMGKVLKGAGISPQEDRRYVYVEQHGSVFPWDKPEAWEQNGGVIATHLGRGTGVYYPEWMYACHKGFLASHPV